MAFAPSQGFVVNFAPSLGHSVGLCALARAISRHLHNSVRSFWSMVIICRCVGHDTMAIQIGHCSSIGVNDLVSSDSVLWGTFAITPWNDSFDLVGLELSLRSSSILGRRYVSSMVVSCQVWSCFSMLFYGWWGCNTELRHKFFFIVSIRIHWICVEWTGWRK